VCVSSSGSSASPLSRELQWPITNLSIFFLILT
jgi:hypothetical protein